MGDVVALTVAVTGADGVRLAAPSKCPWPLSWFVGCTAVNVIGGYAGCGGGREGGKLRTAVALLKEPSDGARGGGRGGGTSLYGGTAAETGRSVKLELVLVVSDVDASLRRIPSRKLFELALSVTVLVTLSAYV